MTPHDNDAGGVVGTALATIGSFIAGYVQSDLIFNELVRLVSSCMIAALGAAIGFFVTRWLRQMDTKWEDIPTINPGAEAPKMSTRIKKATTRRNFARRPKKDE